MKRILILRPSANGDIVMASPLIKALRKVYPCMRAISVEEVAATAQNLLNT